MSANTTSLIVEIQNLLVRLVEAYLNPLSVNGVYTRDDILVTSGSSVAPDTMKMIMKKVFVYKLEISYKIGIQNFVILLIHSWEIALQSPIFDIWKKKAKKGYGT